MKSNYVSLARYVARGGAVCAASLKGATQTIKRVVSLALLTCLLFPTSIGTATAQTAPPGFTISKIANIILPTCWVMAPDGRMFICEQRGRLRVFKNNFLLSTPFITLNVEFTLERGLVGIVLDPDFATNNYIYLFYTKAGDPVVNRVSRFTANGDVVVPNSEVVLLEITDLTSAIHNGGSLRFGPDGKLYISTGDGAIGANSQTLENIKGKILRINKDGTIPEDNPFYNTTTGLNRAIWAYGLRNPYTFAFQNGTGLLYINDVGANSWEEINEGIPGANYGWPDTEGPTNDPRFVPPIFAYRHFSAAITGCAITGGGFYNPPVVTFPQEYVGKYFFADNCNGWIMYLDPATHVVSPFISGLNQTSVDLRDAPDGTLYFVSRSASGLFRVTYQPPVSLGLNVTLEDAPPAGTEVQVELRRVDARPNLARAATLDANGNATLNDITRGVYDVAVKADRWLRKVVRIDISSGVVGDVVVTLLGGDANNDNSVDVLDLDVLIQSFDSMSGDPNWNNGAADFNKDDHVDVLDLDVLIRNFDMQGDP